MNFLMVIASAIVLSSCGSTNLRLAPANLPQAYEERLSLYRGAVAKHVYSTRKWAVTDYDLVEDGVDESGFFHIIVYYKKAPPLPKGTFGGDGYSFTARVDRTKMVVHDEQPIE